MSGISPLKAAEDTSCCGFVFYYSSVACSTADLPAYLETKHTGKGNGEIKWTSRAANYFSGRTPEPLNCTTGRYSTGASFSDMEKKLLSTLYMHAVKAAGLENSLFATQLLKTHTRNRNIHERCSLQCKRANFRSQSSWMGLVLQGRLDRTVIFALGGYLQHRSRVNRKVASPISCEG